jgi:hypothetical protein
MLRSNLYSRRISWRGRIEPLFLCWLFESRIGYMFSACIFWCLFLRFTLNHGSCDHSNMDVHLEIVIIGGILKFRIFNSCSHSLSSTPCHLWSMYEFLYSLSTWRSSFLINHYRIGLRQLRATRFTPRGWANSPWGRLHEISAPCGLEAGLNHTLQ